jgi:hypothetical protein
MQQHKHFAVTYYHTDYDAKITAIKSAELSCISANTRLYQNVPRLALWRTNRWQHRVVLADIMTFNLDRAVCQETSLC